MTIDKEELRTQANFYVISRIYYHIDKTTGEKVYNMEAMRKDFELKSKEVIDRIKRKERDNLDDPFSL